MTENRNYISLKESIPNWLEDSGFDGSYDKPALYKWADDVYREVDESGDYLPFICVLKVEHHKAKLPKNFRKTSFAAGRPDDGKLQCGHTLSSCDCEEKPKKECFKPTCKNEVLQWSEKLFGSDCELKIQLNCNKCNKIDCDCITRDVLLKVDQTMKSTHPWLENNRSGYAYAGDFGRSKSALGKPRKSKQNYGKPRFQKLRYTGNQAFNMEYHLDGCNTDVSAKDCQMSYQMHDLDYIHVDFKEGEVLVVYEGARFDDDGFIMIPDIPALHNAIFYYIEHKLMYQEWKKNRRNPDINSRVDLSDTQYLEQKYEKELVIARGKLNQLNYHKLKATLTDFISRRVAFWHDDFLGKSAPMVTEEYLNHLHGRK